MSKKDSTGVKKDVNKALFWYRKSAENGHHDSMANFANLVLAEKLEAEFEAAYKFLKICSITSNELCMWSIARYITKLDLHRTLKNVRMFANFSQMDSTCASMLTYLNNGLIGIKSKDILKKSRRMYTQDDIDGSMIELAKAIAIGSDVAMLSMQNILAQNLIEDSEHVKKLGTFRLLMPQEHTRLRLNLGLLFQTGSPSLFSKIADDIHQSLLFPIQIPELYKSGNVFRYITEYQKIANQGDKIEDKKLGRKLQQLIDTCVVQKIESRINSYNLYKKSYFSIKDSYSLYSMAFMEENGLGIKSDRKSAIQRYTLVLKNGFRKLVGSRKYVDGEYKREGFAEIITAGTGLIKLYFNQLISYLF